jgi:hypothetical protein
MRDPVVHTARDALLKSRGHIPVLYCGVVNFSLPLREIVPTRVMIFSLLAERRPLMSSFNIRNVVIVAECIVCADQTNASPESSAGWLGLNGSLRRHRGWLRFSSLPPPSPAAALVSA